MPRKLKLPSPEPIEQTFCFRGRDQPETVQLYADLVAFRRPKAAGATRGAAVKPLSLEAAEQVAPLATMRRFEAGGWEFSGDLAAVPDGAQTARVLRKDGRVALATNRLTVHIDPKRTDAEARETLQSHGLRIIQTVPVADNTYLVDVPEGDSFQVANDLVQSGESLYAEPVLIEHIGSR